MRNILSLLTAALLLTMLSCKKNNVTYNKNSLSPLVIEFDNIAGDKDLELNTGVYTNASGETFSVTKLQYFISNIQLINKDGTTFTVPQDSSYFLVSEADAESQEVHLSVPEGEYKTISFIVGVDSARTVMSLDKRTGVLVPADDTYWSAENGYIFFNLEGTSPSAPVTNGERLIKYHIGGFSSTLVNNLKSVSLDLSGRGSPIVLAGHAPEVHLMADILKVFTGTADISIAAHPVIELNDAAANIAANYQAMFRHDHTHNN